MPVAGPLSPLCLRSRPMLVLESLIASRLRALSAFVGWQVREGCDDVSRISLPAVDVRMSGASVTQVRKPSASVQPEWAVTFVVSRGGSAAQQLTQPLRPSLVICTTGVHLIPQGADGPSCRLPVCSQQILQTWLWWATKSLSPRWPSSTARPDQPNYGALQCPSSTPKATI